MIGIYIGNAIGRKKTSLYWTPRNLRVVNIAGGRRLTWDNLTGNNGYEIFISVGGGAFYSLGLTLVDDVSYDDMVDHQNVNIRYKVRAYTGTASSEYSANAPISIIGKKVLTKPVGDEYAYISDNGALDFPDESFTIACWAKVLGASVGDYSYIVGKSVYGAVSGTYEIAYGSDNKYLALMRGVGGPSRVSTAIVNDGLWHFHLMTFDANKDFIYKIDNIIIPGASNPGTPSPMANAFKFLVGAANDNTGSSIIKIGKISIRDIITYDSNLTEAEQIALMQGTIKAGYKAHWKCEAYPLVEEGGNYNLTGVNLSAANIITTPERIIGGKFSAFSSIVTAPELTFNLSSHGNGSGVSTLRFSVSETTTMVLSGTARFYSDAAGTLNESSSAIIEVGALRTFYLKVPSGTATLKVKNVITGWGGNTQALNNTGWYNEPGAGWVNYPFIDIDIALLTNITTLNLFGNNTVHGDMSAHTAMTYIEIGNGSGGTNNSGAGCSITGDVSGMTNLWCLDAWDITTYYGSVTALTTLEILWINGVNTLSGSIANLIKLTTLDIEGNNTITGSLNALTDLEFLYLAGNNTVSGSLSGLTKLHTIQIFSSGAITIPNVTNLTDLSILNPCYTVAFLSANVNQILADIKTNKDVAKSQPLRLITLSDNAGSQAPTGQGLTDLAELSAYRTPNNDGAYPLWTINVKP